MEWERAKSLIVLFFVLLNLALGSMLLMESRRYTVTAERENAIIEILERNNITMETGLLRRFQPMRAMNITGFYYNVDELQRIFFGNTTVTRTSNFSGYIITRRPAELIISNGFISYDNPRGHGGIVPSELSIAEAQRLTDAFVRANWPEFELDGVYEGDDRLRFSYRQVYRGHVIHSNFIEFIVTEIGIVRVEMQFGQVLGWDSENQPIAAPDEALLTFMQRNWAFALVAPMVITRMDLVYFQEDQYGHLAIPFYRVFISGSSDPFLINAVTNEMFH